MPSGRKRNLIYHAALPILGRKCGWKASGEGTEKEVQKILHRRHAAGACIQVFHQGELTDCYCAGFASTGKKVTQDTVFRTASLAKTITALLVMRLQTLGRLNVGEDISEYWGTQIRSPYAPKAPVTLGMLLSHTSGIVDSQAYYDSFTSPQSITALLQNPSSWRQIVPGTGFKYSNMAAGLIGCILEKMTGQSVETLARQELFKPLGIDATYDLSTVSPKRLSDSWRVLPNSLAWDGQKKRAVALPLETPDPEKRYLLAAGNVFLTAADLAKLTLAAWNGADGFLNRESLQQMHTPIQPWPEKELRVEHCMGLFRVDDPQAADRLIWGHQGFAYGAVNGLFFDAEGNGFAMLNSGVSEERLGHLARVNLDLIRLLMGGPDE